LRMEFKKLLDTGEKMVFVNIGANDGLAGDPLREFVVKGGWSGLLIEPVDYVYSRLKQAYRRHIGVTCINAAIDERSGVRPFWHLRKNRILPAGYDQIGSFDKDHLMKHRAMFPGLDDFVTSKEVPCLTLNQILTEHHVTKLDVLLVDVEGFDAQVVRQVDFSRFQPRLIVFEVSHMTADTRDSVYGLLKTNGYAVSESYGNALATRQGLEPAP